jgi:DnaJ domain
MHWLFNKIEFTKQWLIQYGWPLIMTMSEYCSGLATAMIESFGTARDGSVTFLRNCFMKMMEYSCTIMAILEKVWDRTIWFIRHWMTMLMDKFGRHRASETAAAMSPQDRQETIKQVFDAVERGGWYVHYRVLGISGWTVNPNQIKKAYINRAFWAHPNWNTAHGAQEAMRAVNASFKALQSGIAAVFLVVILGAALVGVVCFKQKRQKENLRKTAAWFEDYHGQHAAVVKAVLDAKYGRGTVFEKHCRVLGTRTAATPAEVKKAYHKRSLQVHPDKNKAPDAGKAFRAVKAANIICADYATHRTVTADVQIMIEIVVVQAMWMIKDAYNVCTHRAGTANAPTVIHCVIASLAAAIAGTVTGYILVNFVSK